MFRSLLRRSWELCREEDGLTAVEYAVILGLVIVACLSAIVLIGTNMFGYVSSDGSIPASGP